MIIFVDLLELLQLLRLRILVPIDLLLGLESSFFSYFQEFFRMPEKKIQYIYLTDLIDAFLHTLYVYNDIRKYLYELKRKG